MRLLAPAFLFMAGSPAHAQEPVAPEAAIESAPEAGEIAPGPLLSLRKSRYAQCEGSRECLAPWFDFGALKETARELDAAWLACEEESFSPEEFLTCLEHRYDAEPFEQKLTEMYGLCGPRGEPHVARASGPTDWSSPCDAFVPEGSAERTERRALLRNLRELRDEAPTDRPLVPDPDSLPRSAAPTQESVPDPPAQPAPSPSGGS